MSVDSKASFQSRARDIGVPEGRIAALEAKNVATFSAFAFICSYQPGTPDETPFIDALKSSLGGDPSAHLSQLCAACSLRATA